MKRKVYFILNLIICILFCNITTIHTYAVDSFIVDVSQQIYSYDSMVEDIAMLTATHEDILSFESIGTTSQGRNVWLLKFGNLQAENKILITGSIHAREYMSSQLIMRMLEEYIMNFDIPLSDGTTYRQRFDTVCFYILPMVNPDGVSISQFGIDGAIHPATQNWLQGLRSSNAHLTQIKSNANGVDINRNFPVGFGIGNVKSPLPSLYYYCGPHPLSEAESQGLSNLVMNEFFVCGINYHSMGNVIYYGSSANTPQNAAQCKDMAALVSSINGYRREYCGSAIGSFADFFGAVQNVPSVTIEIGTANPVPISQFSNIYKRNINVWPVIGNLY